MEMTGLMFTIIALAIGSPSPADGIRVSPGEAHPGQRIHITVPDCGVGPTRHTAISAAFTRRATLYGKADTGEADPRLKDVLAPGTYRITASCGTSTAYGQVVVPGQQRPSPHKSGSDGSSYWVFGAVLAGGAALLVARRRRRGNT